MKDEWKERTALDDTYHRSRRCAPRWADYCTCRIALIRWCFKIERRAHAGSVPGLELGVVSDVSVCRNVSAGGRAATVRGDMQIERNEREKASSASCLRR